MSISLTGHNKRIFFQTPSQDPSIKPSKKKQKTCVDSDTSAKIVKLDQNIFFPISQFLSARSMYNLSNTCSELQYLKRFIQIYTPDSTSLLSKNKKKFWVNILSLSKFGKVSTEHLIKKRAIKNGDTTFPNQILQTLAKEWLSPAFLSRVLLDTVGKRKFKQMDLSGSSAVTDLVLQELAKQQTSLRHLDLSNCSSISNEGLKFINTISSLRHLNLTGCAVSDTGLEALKDLSLNFLDLSECEISDQGLRSINPRYLTHLTLRDCKRITNIGITHFKSPLRGLDISGCSNITEIIFDQMDCRLLEYLNISGCSDIVSQALSKKKFPALESLYLNELKNFETHITKIIEGLHTNGKLLSHLDFYQSHVGISSKEILQLEGLSSHVRFSIYTYSGNIPYAWDDETPEMDFSTNELQEHIAQIKEVESRSLKFLEGLDPEIASAVHINAPALGIYSPDCYWRE